MVSKENLVTSGDKTTVSRNILDPCNAKDIVIGSPIDGLALSLGTWGNMY